MTPDASTVLIPIDLQQGFAFAPWRRRDNPELEANGQRLLAAWRERAWPLIHVRHDSVQAGSPLHPDHPGNAFLPGFEPRDEEAVVSKSVNAAFIGTDLDLRLRRLGARRIVLFGISGDMCVSTSARVAANYGYEVIVVGDACACFDLDDYRGEPLRAEDIRRAHLATLHAEFARVIDTSALIATLQPSVAARNS